MTNSANAPADIIIYGSGGSLNEADIKYNDYLRSLVTEAERLGLIGEAETTRIKISIMDGLREVIGFWTNEESSSVMADTANRLMHSMLFDVDCYLISLGTREAALDAVLNNDIVTLYYGGQRRLRRYICEAAGLVVKVRHSRIDLPNAYYIQTIDRGLHNALKNYDVRYGAHMSPSFEYPLAVESKNLRGMHYLRGYMLSLQNENEFCRCFDTDQVKQLYGTFCSKHHFPLTEPRTNLYLMILTNALLCAYLQKDDGDILLSEDECDIIIDLLDGQTEEEITAKFTAIAEGMKYGSREYNLRAAASVIPGLASAIVNGRLKNFAVSEL